MKSSKGNRIPFAPPSVWVTIIGILAVFVALRFLCGCTSPPAATGPEYIGPIVTNAAGDQMQPPDYGGTAQ